MTRWSVETGSSLSVAAKVLLVGGRRCSLCAHAHERPEVIWRALAAAINAVDPGHTQRSWEWWSR